MTDTQSDNTYVFDPESASEMARLIDQGRTLTTAMGGPWVGLPDLTAGAQVIDLGCGPGGWVLDVAYAYPEIEVAGVDISQTMISYANARAQSQGLNNATFGVMDIRQPLDFADNTFDVVNGRTLFSVLRRDAWRPFLAECLRILKPGGILHLTEIHDFGVTSSPAIERLLAQGTSLMWQWGYGFSVDGRTFGIVPILPGLLRQAGCAKVHYLAHAVEFSFGTSAWFDFYRNYQVTMQQGKSLNVNAGAFTEEEYDQLYQQAFIDMQRDDFWGMNQFVTVVGYKL